MYKKIGDSLIIYHRGKTTATDLLGTPHNAYYAFVVGANEKENIHNTAKQWSESYRRNEEDRTPFTLSNHFVRGFITTSVSHRQSQKVMRIILQHKNGEEVEIDLTVEHMLENILPYFQINKGVIDGDMVICKTKSGTKTIVVPRSVFESNEVPATPDKQISITKTKLKVGTKYVTRTMELVYLGEQNGSQQFYDLNRGTKSAYVQLRNNVKYQGKHYALDLDRLSKEDFESYYNKFPIVDRIEQGNYGNTWWSVYFKTPVPRKLVDYQKVNLKCDSIEENYMSDVEIQEVYTLCSNYNEIDNVRTNWEPRSTGILSTLTNMLTTRGNNMNLESTYVEVDSNETSQFNRDMYIDLINKVGIPL